MSRVALLFSCLLAGLPLAALAESPQIFRIGTAGVAGTYFPVGGLISLAISNPPGSRACDEGGSCGVPGLMATALSSNGSVANVNGILGGSLESGFVQADSAAWARCGTGFWEGEPPEPRLTAIAALYPEAIHLVAGAGSGIASVADLRGKRVSMDELGSGTLPEARLVLAAHGLSEDHFEASYLKPDQAAQALGAGDLDAFFFVGGYPARAITDLADSASITLVPINGSAAGTAADSHVFLEPTVIPAGTYAGVDRDVPSLAVWALWATSTDQPEALIHDVTAALWNSATRKLLDEGHAKARVISLETALSGISVPLHPGARRFYEDQGLSFRDPGCD